MLIKKYYLSILMIAPVLLFSNVWDYPVTPKDSITEIMHGTEVKDAYRWLENASDPRVMRWTEDQNALSRAYLKSVLDKTSVVSRLDALARRIVEQYTEVSNGGRFIWRKDVQDDRPIYYWQEYLEGPVKELINSNLWPAGDTLEFAVPSPDGTYVAFGVSCGGNERPYIKIMHVESGEILSDTFVGQKQGWPDGLLAWLPDNSGLYYSTYPLEGKEADYWHSLYFHTLGTTSEKDICVLAHDSIRECHHIAAVSDSARYVAFSRYYGINSQSEVFILDRETSQLAFVTQGTEALYHVSFAGDNLVMMTNLDAPNWRAFLVDPARPERVNWKLLIPESSDPLLNVQGIAGHFFAVISHHAHTIVKVFDENGEVIRNVPLPGLGTAAVSGLWSSRHAGITYTSFVHPLTHYHYDLERNVLEGGDALPALVDASRYSVEQVWYSSVDGTSIPMFLIHDTTTMPTNGLRPTLLTGYGGFGIAITPEFIELYLPFLEAGGLVAIANLRGGGEYGESWHRAGMLENKQNVFDDFISAAEWLIAHEYTTSAKLAIRGRSNGGLLVGAALTQRPELFRAVLCEVPLLDMVRYHKFGYSSVWAEEYGSSENVDQFHYLLRYSPYHRVLDGVHYPAVLVRASQNDARTDALHARKMIARLQAADARGNPKFLIIDEGAGHFGGTTLTERVVQRAEGLAFMMDQLGMIER